MTVVAIDAPRTPPVRTPAARTATAHPPAVPQPPAAATRQRLSAVPGGAEARGFVLYVGIDEHKAAAAGTTLGQIVEALKALTSELAPAAETYAAVALAPAGAGGRDVDVVRLALHDPAALGKHQEEQAETDDDDSLVIDISRKRVVIDDEIAGLTYKEFELLQYLVLREGRTIDRAELIGSLWQAGDTETPNERTIDVHVRRLRAKLGRYDSIVRTVRGVGYRFDRHPDVVIHHLSTNRSPDLV